MNGVFSLMAETADTAQTADGILSALADVNKVVNDFVWVKIGLWLLIGSGIVLTVLLKFFQIVHIKTWVKATIGSLFSKKIRTKTEKGSVSQFQALCTALASTIGTGNIVGVSSAIAIGGPGAVFWMWVAALFGMMTSFSENVLGIYFRRRNENGEWSGGAMYYLRHGLGRYKHMKAAGKTLAVLFSVFAVLASFGIGNCGQINKITINLENAFFKSFDAVAFADIKWTSIIIGLVLTLIAGLVIFGGLQRIAATSEKVVPIMALLYIFGSIAVICTNIGIIGDIFSSIFRFAFGIEAVGGAVAGITIKEVVTQGCKRGVFSNEAGLGSSVMVNSASSTKEPVVQGMWGIFQVFFDTIIVCTMTAIVVLSSGAIDLQTGANVNGGDGSTFVQEAFGAVFGPAGEMFMAVCILLFAFTTVLGWSHYGTKSVEYLFGVKAAKVYKIIFVAVISLGAVMTSSIAWDISDTFNGLMMIPNLIGVIALSPIVIKITKNYIDRKIKHKEVEPVLSDVPEIQAEFAEAVKSEE